MLPALPRWIAHRGGGSAAPENTLAGIRRAAEAGLRAVEFDVMLSADGTPALMHDETLERTTNGRGRVADTPDAVLFALDAGGEPVPCFADAARLCRQLGLFANIEIKPATGHEAETAAVVAAMARRCWAGADDLPLLSSFSETALQVAARVAPELPRGWLVEAPPVDWLPRLRALPAVALHCAAEAVDAPLLAQAREAGVPVLAYTVNTPEAAASLFAAGVSALFTDSLALAQQI